jgi:hypothetical protein
MQLKWNYRKISMNTVATLRGIETEACLNKSMQVTGFLAGLRIPISHSHPPLAFSFKI